jgi:hypothetical protein
MLKKKVSIVLVLGILAALVLSACSQSGAASRTQAENPTTIVQTYLQAINNKQLDTAMSFLADDASMSYPGGKIQGKQAIRKAYQDFIDGGYRTEASNFRESSGEVRYDYKVYFGDEMVDQNTDGLAIIKDGKIVFDGLERDKPSP